MEKEKHPCVDCVTYSICKATIDDSNESLYNLITKCKIIDEYIAIKFEYLKFTDVNKRRYNDTLKIFNVEDRGRYFNINKRYKNEKTNTPLSRLHNLLNL